MLAQSIWWLAILLEGVVLLRGLNARLLGRFPLFYTYLFFVLAQDVLRFISYHWLPRVYANLYWLTQFLSLILGSVVVFEIYRLALREFPGTARMAKYLLGAAFAGIFLKAILILSRDEAAWINGAYVKLERDLRAVQSIAIIILLILFIWYAIPFGRNLGGIFLGYSVFVATSVMQLSIVSHYWHKAEHFWAVVQPISYVFVLVFWALTLWRSDAFAKRSRTKTTDVDYETLAGRTAGLLEEARSHLETAVRP